MEYLADTVTIIRHLTDSGKIGKGARDILSRVESDQDTLLISVISLMEIMYPSERKWLGRETDHINATIYCDCEEWL